MHTTVADVMTRDVVSVDAEMTVAELDQVLLDHRITGAPVVDGGRVVGVVSIVDVLFLLRLADLDMERMSGFYVGSFSISVASLGHLVTGTQPMIGRLSEWQVRDVMSTQVLCVSSSDDVATAAQRMLKHDVHRLLVIDGADLVGMVSAFDLLPLVVRFTSDREAPKPD
jgi:CBS domain-containing protein